MSSCSCNEGRGRRVNSDRNHLWYQKCVEAYQIDTAKRRLQRNNHGNQSVRVFLVYLNVERIQISKLFEKHSLSFHDRLRSMRAYIAQPKDSCAISNNSDQVTLSSESDGSHGNSFVKSKLHSSFSLRVSIEITNN